MINKRPTIMVVDDSTTSISLYEFSTDSLAVDLISFTSPVEALAYLQEHQPDLLFLDIIMPGMDGLTFLKHMREYPHQKATPVIVVTSKDYAQDRYIAKQLGALDFVIKPLRFKEIQDLVCKHISIKL